MKTKIISVVFFMAISISANAQFNVGLNGEFSVPTKDIGAIINFSTGGELFVGYKINDRIDFNLAYSYSYFKTMAIESQNISGLSLNVKYFLTRKGNRFYLGFGTGKYNMNVVVMPGQESLEFKGWGIKPAVGMLLKAGFLENLYFNSSLSYLSYFKDINQNMFSLNLGVVYYLKAKQ